MTTTKQSTMKTETFGYSPIEYQTFKKSAWLYLALFSAMYATHYCTRLNLSNVSALMISDLGWTTADVGILTGTLFWTYGFGHLINGRLGEVFGPHKFVMLSLLLSVAANICMGFTNSLLAMTIIWGMNGYFQSMAWSPGIATLTKWWPGNTRGFANGFAYAFTGFGQVVATLSVTLALTILPDLGWRAAFIIPPLFPLVMVAVFKLFAKPSPASIGLAEYKEVDEQKARNEAEMASLVKTRGKLYPYRYLLTKGRFLVWLVVAFFAGLARYGLVTWVPLYFIEVFHIDVTDGLLQSLALPLGMGIGTLIVPSLTDRFCPNNRLIAVVVSAFVGAVAIYIFFLLDPTIPLQFVFVELLLFIAGFCISAITGTAWAYAADIGGRVFSGTAAGIVDFSAYMGAAVQSVLYGFLLKSGGWNIVFVSVAAFCLIISMIGAFFSVQIAKAHRTAK